MSQDLWLTNSKLLLPNLLSFQSQSLWLTSAVQHPLVANQDFASFHWTGAKCAQDSQHALCVSWILFQELKVWGQIFFTLQDAHIRWAGVHLVGELYSLVTLCKSLHKFCLYSVRSQIELNVWLKSWHLHLKSTIKNWSGCRWKSVAHRRCSLSQLVRNVPMLWQETYLLPFTMFKP